MGDPELVYDEEREVFRFRDGRFDFSLGSTLTGGCLGSVRSTRCGKWHRTGALRGSGLPYDLAPRPKINRVHGVAPVALVVAGGGADPYLAEAPVEDVGPMATTIHP